MWALRQCTMWSVRQVIEAHEIAIPIWSRDLGSGSVRESQRRGHRLIIVALIITVYAPKFSLTPTVTVQLFLHSHDHQP